MASMVNSLHSSSNHAPILSDTHSSSRRRLCPRGPVSSRRFCCLQAPNLLVLREWHVHEVKKFDVPVRPEAQRDIACYETLAQAFLVLLCTALCPHACVPLHFKSLSDNAATEASGNKLFTTSAPLCYFVEHLAHILVSARVTCDISHIPGSLNQDADLLSRWNFHDPLPVKFTADTRHRMSLEHFFSFHRGAQIHPETFPVQWSLDHH